NHVLSCSKQTQMLRGRGRQDQPGVRDSPVIIEGHPDRGEALAGFHSEGALSFATAGGVENRHRRNRKGTFRGYASPTYRSTPVDPGSVEAGCAPDRALQLRDARGARDRL